MLTNPSAPLPNAAAYWERRAREYAGQGRGLAAVCSYAMPEFYNRYIHLTQRRALARWLAPLARGEKRTALDAGCGVGRWSQELARCGYDVTGVDISPSMIEHARARSVSSGSPGLRGSCAFQVGNVAELHLARVFDLVLSVTVIQHILHEATAQHAFARLAEHLAPGGKLVMLEVAPSQPTGRCDSAVFNARTLEWHREALGQAGLELVEVWGVDPAPFKTWLLPHYRALPPAVAQLALLGVTAASVVLDIPFAARMTDNSWHKVLVAQRAGESRRR